jgi:hypothetical protein
VVTWGMLWHWDGQGGEGGLLPGYERERFDDRSEAWWGWVRVGHRLGQQGQSGEGQ